VVATTSGLKNVDLPEERGVDAVILDYRMPEMMGDAVAARMKQLRPEVPIMMLSAAGLCPARRPALHRRLSTQERACAPVRGCRPRHGRPRVALPPSLAAELEATSVGLNEKPLLRIR